VIGGSVLHVDTTLMTYLVCGRTATQLDASRS